MIRVFDFTCRAGHVTEHFVDADIEEVQCHCGSMGKRQIATPRVKLEGTTGSFPTAADKWDRKREQHLAKERRNLDNHGTYD